jgi:GntR family transcriptional regulator/MocR family aminotransferase
MDLARTHRIAILEDDDDFEYYYGTPVLPLASLDPTGQVIYMGSISRMLAPSVRLSFLVAPVALVDRLARVRRRVDAQGDRVLEWAIADLIRDGDLTRHVRKVRKVYQERRDRFAGLLRACAGTNLSFSIPEGGLALWVRIADGLDVEAWARRCGEKGLVFKPGRFFSFGGEHLPFARLGFSMLDEEQIRDVCSRLCAELPVI